MGVGSWQQAQPVASDPTLSSRHPQRGLPRTFCPSCYDAAPMHDDLPRSGRCAIVGRPNVGKSTLLNTLLGQKLAIATSRPQTTRNCILGIYTSADPRTQIAFVDTPGMHRPHNALGRAIQENAKTALNGVDLVVMMTDVESSTRAEDFLRRGGDAEVLTNLSATERPIILVLNKVDRLRDKTQLFPLLTAAEGLKRFEAFVPMSARRGQNVPGLISELRKHLPEGLQYPEDMLTDRPEKFFVAELIREAAIEQTAKEVPYSVAVTIDQFEDDASLSRIHATIVVPKDSHKGILIGKGGARLKAIGIAARTQAEMMLERKVYLKLWVKVMDDWTNHPSQVRDLMQDDVG